MFPEYPQQTHPQGEYPHGPAAYPAQMGYSPAPPAKRRGTWIAAVLAGAVMVGGGAYGAHRYLDAPGARKCAAAAGLKYTAMKPKSDGEPVVSVPLAAGWSQFPLSSFPQATNPSIRGVIASEALRDKGFTPNAVMTLDKVAADDVTTDELLDREVNGIASVGTVNEKTPGTVCGFPAVRVEVTGQQNVSAVAVVLTDPRDVRWIATATIQTRNPFAPNYVAERDALLDGLTISFDGEAAS